MNPETRTVTVGYLHELYETIERQKGEIAACHAVLAAVGRQHRGPVTDAVLDAFLNDAADVDSDVPPGVLDELTERQQEVVLLRARGLHWSEIAASLGLSEKYAKDVFDTAERQTRRRLKHRHAVTDRRAKV